MKSKLRNRTILSLLSAVITTAITIVILGNNGSISIYGPFQIDSSSSDAPHRHWEQYCAAGNTWVTSWTEFFHPTDEFQNGQASYVSTWIGAWSTPQLLVSPRLYNTPKGLRNEPLQDLHITWDQRNSRFVLVALGIIYHDIWMGCSNCGPNNVGWGIYPTPAISGANFDADYPSIGVNAQAGPDGKTKIIIGAIRFSGGALNGFWTVRGDVDPANPNNSTNITWTSPSRVGTYVGIASRVVGTNTKFQAFVPRTDSMLNPTGVYRYESTDGQTWTQMPTLAWPYGSPHANSRYYYSTNCTPGSSCPSCPPQGPPPLMCNIANFPCGKIGFGIYIDAKGSPDGNWAVTWPINNNSYNNAYICTSDRGCGVVNQALNDQFAISVSAAPESGGGTGYWVSYYTFANTTNDWPVIAQSIYFPPGRAAIGATVYSSPDLDPRSWTPTCVTGSSQDDGGPCGRSNCFAMGDYTGMASNGYAGSLVTMITKGLSFTQTAFTSVFPYDPPQQPTAVLL